MIIHSETASPKPIEQKVQKLILQKLFIKVDDSKLFVNKEDYVDILLKDVIAIAKASYDIDEAVKIAVKEQPHYQQALNAKRIELEEAAVEFAVEVDAYFYYLESLTDGTTDTEIYDQVSLILNMDSDIVYTKLHELMIEALSSRLSEADAAAGGFDRYAMLDVYANQVKLIASNATLEDAVEEAYSEFENYPKKHEVKIESIKREFERFAPLVQDEVSAYKLALSLHDQNAEIPMILAMVKQMLHLN